MVSATEQHRVAGAVFHPAGVSAFLSFSASDLADAYDGTNLPTDWLTALDALERSEWAREALGEAFLGVYLKVKRAEYRQFMAEVSEQDWRWYLHQA